MTVSREATVTQIILRIEQEVFRAIQHKDVDSLGRFLAEDFIHRSPDGTTSAKSAFLQNVASMPVEVVSIGGEHQNVDIYGEVAVLTGVQRAGWRQDDITEGVSVVAFTDVFAWRSDRWLMVLAYTIELENQ